MVQYLLFSLPDGGLTGAFLTRAVSYLLLSNMAPPQCICIFDCLTAFWHKVDDLFFNRD